MKQLKQLLWTCMMFSIPVMMSVLLLYCVSMIKPTSPINVTTTFPLVALNLTNETNTITHGNGNMIFLVGSMSYDSHQQLQQYYQFYIRTDAGVILRKLEAQSVYIIESDETPKYIKETKLAENGYLLKEKHTLYVPRDSIKRGYQLNIFKDGVK